MAAKYDDPFSELPDTTPVYRLLKDHYMEDDVLHPEDEVIAFTGTPTEWMEPLNDPARNVMRTYLTFLDKCAQEAAEKQGRPFTGRITDLGDQIAQAMNDARTADAEGKLNVVLPERRDVPQRPDLIPVGQRRKGPGKLLASKSAPVGGKPTPKPVSVQGKNYDHDAGGNSSL
jgi:hypothetical protein